MACEINISELRFIVNALLDHIEIDLNTKIVSIDSLDYWDVSNDERVLFKQPNGYVVGNLKDDLEFLYPLITGAANPVSLMLDHVAPLLRYIGQKVGS